MNRIYLVRHGENTANLTFEFSYRKVDYSLTAKGVLQAQQTAAWLRQVAVDEIYSSPLKRALETAQIIAAPHGLPVHTLEAFRELNVGDLEGQPPTPALWEQHDAILAAWKDGHPEQGFPGGENYHTLLQRVSGGLKEVLAGKQGRSIVIAGHGGIFAFALRGLCRGVDRAMLERGIPNCAVTELEAQVEGDRLEARLVSFAAVDHLSGSAAQLSPGRPTSPG